MGIKLWKVGDTCWTFDYNVYVVRQCVIVAIHDDLYDLKWISRYDNRSHYIANVRAKELFHTMEEAIDARIKWVRHDLALRSEKEHTFQEEQ